MNKRKLLANTISYDDEILKELKNPNEAATYLQVAFDEFQEDNDIEAFLVALRRVVDAQGGISNLSEITGLNRQSLYKTLSETGNPKLDTFGLIMKNLGFKLQITPATDKRRVT